MDDFERLTELFEKGAASPPSAYADQVQNSVAISLKRIADALEMSMGSSAAVKQAPSSHDDAPPPFTKGLYLTYNQLDDGLTTLGLCRSQTNRTRLHSVIAALVPG
jgi:molecular chaperone GrpE (heat shock protein)